MYFLHLEKNMFGGNTNPKLSFFSFFHYSLSIVISLYFISLKIFISSILYSYFLFILILDIIDK